MAFSESVAGTVKSNMVIGLNEKAAIAHAAITHGISDETVRFLLGVDKANRKEGK